MDAVDWYNTYGAWYHKAYATETVNGYKCFRYYYYSTTNGSGSYVIDNRTVFKFPPDCQIPLKLDVYCGSLSVGQTIAAMNSNTYTYGIVGTSDSTEFLSFSWTDTYGYTGASRACTGTAKDTVQGGRFGVVYNCSYNNQYGTPLESDGNATYSTLSQARLFNGFFAGNVSYNKYSGDRYVARLKLYYI